MSRPDSYRSEDAENVHQFLVIIYYAGAPIISRRVEANCYADAVQAAAPGNDALKIEVIAL